MNTRWGSRCLAALVAAAALSIQPVRAQENPDSTAPAPTSSAITAPSGSSLMRGTIAELFSVYVPRPSADIQKKLDSARELQIALTEQITQATSLAGEA